MNISASNQSLENIIIRQEKEKKRPSFASVFEKINKRTANMNRITPLNNKLTNEQLFRYYLKETDPKLSVSDDAFGEDETTLADLITNRSLNKSKVNQTIQTDDGDDASTQNVDEYLRIVEEINDEQQQNKSQSFVDRSSFFDLKDNVESPFKSNESFQKNFENWYKSFGETRLDLYKDAFEGSINPMYEGSANDFVSSLVGYTSDKTERLQNSLMEAGVDPKEIEISPIKTARTIRPVKPTKLVEQLVGAKTKLKEFGPDLLQATAEEIRNYETPEIYHLMRGQDKPLSGQFYRILDEPLWRPTNKKGNWKDWAKAKYDKHDWYDDTVLDRAATAIKSTFKGHLVRNRIRDGIVNNLVDDVMGKTVTDAVSLLSKKGRGRPTGSKNKVITPTNMRTRSSKDTEGFV